MVGTQFNGKGLGMKKWIVLLLSLVVVMTLPGCTDGKKRTNASGGGSSVAMSEAEHEDFIEYMKQRANCGELFRTIMESFEETCEIFDDYVVSDDVYMTMSLSGLREQLSSSDFSGNSGYEVY